jgi:hypothetical protein
VDLSRPPSNPPAVDRRLARALGLGARAGFWLTVAAGALYLSGLLPAVVPLAELPRYWSLPAARFGQATGWPAGWHAFADLARGDALALAGIAVLLLVPSLSALSLLPAYRRARDHGYVLLVLALVAIGVGAAWGLSAAAGPR